jgi:hypothetical protein
VVSSGISTIGGGGVSGIGGGFGGVVGSSIGGTGYGKKALSGYGKSSVVAVPLSGYGKSSAVAVPLSGYGKSSAVAVPTVIGTFLMLQTVIFLKRVFCGCKICLTFLFLSFFFFIYKDTNLRRLTMQGPQPIHK